MDPSRHSRRPRVGLFPRALVAVAVAAAVLLASGCGQAEAPTSATDDAAVSETAASPQPEEQSSVGNVPDTLAFTGKTVTGEPFDGAMLTGKPVVLWFWAPWCPTCRGQIPMMTSLDDSYGDSVTFVGVGGLDDSADAIAEFADEVDGFTHLSDPEGAIWQHFGVTAQSTFVVLDPAGKVRASGVVDEAELTDLVRELAG